VPWGKLMFGAFGDVLFTILCYVYILLVIFVSGRLGKVLHVSRRVSRKFLHAMIGNLPFVLPFFSSNVYPVLVAAPFILATFLMSPFSPFAGIRERFRELADMTEEGHPLGPVFYAVSYTVLALFFASKPCVVAAGIFPMAYGDSAASLIGERYGKTKYKLFVHKSLEGSAAMFLASFFSLAIGLVFFSQLYSFSVFEKILAAFAAASVATLVESFSPFGFDNLTVPVFSALTFLLLDGGI